jgi:hypothetical protein
MLEIVKAALPTFVSVAPRGALVVPTAWFSKVTVVVLTEKPAVETGTAAVLAPPAQDVDHTAKAMQAMARITEFARSRISALVFMPNNSLSTCATKLLKRSVEYP